MRPVSAVRAGVAGWVLILGVAGFSAGVPEENSVERSPLGTAPGAVELVGGADQDGGSPMARLFDSGAPLLKPTHGVWPSTPSAPAEPGGAARAESSLASVSSSLASNMSTLGLLFSCLTLLGGIGYMVRQLHNAKTQLERRTLDLSRSNEQLKREVAERRLTENALRASENFYSSLVETVPQNIFRKDLAGKYTFANRAFCATLGKPPVEIIGRTDHDLFPAELAARFRREDEQLLAAGKQIEIEQPYPMPGGGKVSVLMIKTPLFDFDGRTIGIQGIFWDVSDRKRAEKELGAVHRQLIEASRRVGMAEVATGVLHNVGNVLNSVNVSATLVCERIKKSRVLTVGRAAALLSEHAEDPKFLTDDPRGKQLPGYLKDLGEHLRREQATILGELSSLVNNVEHIKEIVVMQQANAKLSGMSVAVKTSEIVEDALRMNSASLTRHEVQVVREYQDDPIIVVDKHAVLQTLVNLIRNAKHACDECQRPDKQIGVRIWRSAKDRISIQVIDNGVGIPPENLSRLFSRGFTTRADGHGFGLHSCLMAAQEMGGGLTAHSEGPGLGAVFTLNLPCQPEGVSQ
jgi:PAS domain S-box-containing protein